MVVDPKSPGGINSPHDLILFDGVCVLCSRGCRFVSKRDRRGYFRFVPIQVAEGRPLAEQLGLDPDRPDSFALVGKGKGYVKSEAVQRIAHELPRWQWTWVFHFIPRVIRDALYDVVARNRYRWFGRRDACMLPNSDRSWPREPAPRLRNSLEVGHPSRSPSAGRDEADGHLTEARIRCPQCFASQYPTADARGPTLPAHRQGTEVALTMFIASRVVPKHRRGKIHG